MNEYDAAMDKHGIPKRMQGGLRRWIYNGVEPGDFLQAVLQNDLTKTFAKADDENVQIIRNYLMFLYNDAPSGCSGSMEKYEIWQRNGGLTRYKV